MVGVFLRGVAMGAADIVPGVSGGTIAFITGIYFRLLTAINSLPRAFVQEVCRGRLKTFWEVTDATFLATLLTGILFAVITLASIISYALAEHAIPVWSFFFGLITASVWHVGREIVQPGWRLLFPLILGAVSCWLLTTLTPMQATPSTLVLFGAGAVAICAMILPGISGSFILLLLGLYGPVLEAVKTFDLGKLLVFGAGCVVGLLSIARLLTWAVNRFHDWVLAFLTGVMVGALNKVWPWKETVSLRLDSSGEQVPLKEVNVSPQAYADLTGASPELLAAILAAAAGFVLVVVIEWGASLSKNGGTKSEEAQN
jgi:putative membrane protein